ncbi:Hypothetical protein, putative [Bodo saltans]|uniref:Uncharacterized protein n=1 Tax=Bodo saltans TaxID=75058 RepID=A0A0S4IYK3_BODSA|nr:Hypothetical protein, putative [Bodo saltans]|eukprot:CUG19778.1 Hypothetical protein, putative [Bodo saltans]
MCRYPSSEIGLSTTDCNTKCRGCVPSVFIYADEMNKNDVAGSDESVPSPLSDEESVVPPESVVRPLPTVSFVTPENMRRESFVPPLPPVSVAPAPVREDETVVARKYDEDEDM